MNPSDQPAPITQSTWYDQPWFKRVAIIIGIILALGALAGTVVALIWQTSPQKALYDAADYAIKTPGKYHIKSADLDIALSLSDQQYAATGKLAGVQLDVVGGGSTLFVKTSSPQKLYQKLVGAPVQGIFAPLFNKILALLPNRWFVINLKSSPVQSSQVSDAQCLLSGKNVLASDGSSRQQMAGSYLAHSFLDIQTAAGSTSQSTYKVTVNGDKATQFYKDFSATNFYQSLTDCPQPTNSSPALNLQDAEISATISQSAHVLKSLSIDSGKTHMDVTADYSSVPKITFPTDAISIDGLTSNIFQSFIAG